MNWNSVQGKWDQVKGEAKIKWGKLTDDDMSQIHGNRDKLVGKLQERYGLAKDEASRQADTWVKQL